MCVDREAFRTYTDLHCKHLKLFRRESIDLITLYTRTEYVLQEQSYFFLTSSFKLDTILRYIF